MGMPIAFLLKDEEYSLVAVLGLEPSTNYFLSADGQWRGNYVPALYRGYPFVLASNEKDKQLILCINEDSGLLREDDSAESILDDNGELSPFVKQIVDLLTTVASGRRSIAVACRCMAKHNLFKPWDIEIELKDGKKCIEGLFCVDEAAFNKLPDEAHIELRKSGALSVIYSQLLSMIRISDLIQFAQVRFKTEIASPSDELELEGVYEDGNISFDNI